MSKKIYLFIVLLAATALYSSCDETLHAHGKDNYTRLCSNCHGENGEGLLGLVPPLAGSDYLKNNKNVIACIIKNGINGELVVNGTKYNQGMPALVGNYTSADISNISNYVLNAWGNNYGELTFPEVEQQLAGCKRDNF